MWGFNVNESYQEILKKIECPYGHTSVYCTTTRKDCRAEARIILERVKTDNENNKILLHHGNDGSIIKKIIIE